MKAMALLLAVVLVISVPLSVSAAPRTLSIWPVLAYNGTTAICETTVFANSSDYIEVTMKLMFKGWCKEKWTAAGYGDVYMLEYEDVLAGSTYDLVVQVTINGVSQTPVSVSRTC